MLNSKQLPNSSNKSAKPKCIDQFYGKSTNVGQHTKSLGGCHYVSLVNQIQSVNSTNLNWRFNIHSPPGIIITFRCYLDGLFYRFGNKIYSLIGASKSNFPRLVNISDHPTVSSLPDLTIDLYSHFPTRSCIWQYYSDAGPNPDFPLKSRLVSAFLKVQCAHDVSSLF